MSAQKKIVVLDGQGGRIGAMLIERMKAEKQPWMLYAIGTNSIATAAMLRAGADFGATGENPAVVNCRDADVIVGPIGIVIADALLGEITPAMAVAAGQSRAEKILLPINRCNNVVIGVRDMPIGETIGLAVERVALALA